jgi:tRNA nucleotidyltransferase (CCA-adding enzyme)
MDEDYEILDYTGGLDDLRSRVIRTIGDPAKRFSEDALRILRAPYFQAKLGFSIDEPTLEAMAALREKIMLLSRERVYEIICKTVFLPNYKLAFRTYVCAGIHRILPGLERGIEFFDGYEQIRDLSMEIFFAVCFILNGQIDPYWPLTNKHRAMFETTLRLIKEPNLLDNRTLFENGEKIIVFASRIRHLLYGSEHSARGIYSAFAQLPLKSQYELALRGADLLELTGRKPGLWLSETLNLLVDEVLNNRIPNEKEALISFLKERKIC